MQPPVILCIGRIDRSEFRDALPSLEPWGRVRVVPDIPVTLAQLTQDHLIPDVIVIAQSYPGEFSDAGIDRLRAAAPLARLVALLGTWCEGELRSGTPWSGGVRVYWHQWMPHSQQELKRLLNGHKSIWSLPPTACEEERCQATAVRPVDKKVGWIEIVTEQYDVFDWLAAACSVRGYQSRWRRVRDEPFNDVPTAVLFDAAGDLNIELTRFRQLCTGRSAPTLVLADFPRSTCRDRFLQAGAHAVLSRPFFWEDLFWYLQ